MKKLNTFMGIIVGLMALESNAWWFPRPAQRFDNNDVPVKELWVSGSILGALFGFRVLKNYVITRYNDHQLYKANQEAKLANLHWNRMKDHANGRPMDVDHFDNVKKYNKHKKMIEDHEREYLNRQKIAAAISHWQKAGLLLLAQNKFVTKNSKKISVLENPKDNFATTQAERSFAKLLKERQAKVGIYRQKRKIRKQKIRVPTV